MIFLNNLIFFNFFIDGSVNYFIDLCMLCIFFIWESICKNKEYVMQFEKKMDIVNYVILLVQIYDYKYKCLRFLNLI